MDIKSYRFRFLIYLLLLILSLVLATLVIDYLFDSKPAQNGSQGVIIQGNSLVGFRIPYYYKSIPLGALIGELIECESGGNNEAIGQAGEVGILQFMPSTFQAFCVEKYGLEDDIYNRYVQKQCAQRMLNDGLEAHWTCWFKINEEEGKNKN